MFYSFNILRTIYKTIVSALQTFNLIKNMLKFSKNFLRRTLLWPMKRSFSEQTESVLTIGRSEKRDIKVSLERDNLGEKSVFFDFQSTTPLDPRVLDTMLPFLTSHYGNPHSKSHVFGWQAEKAVEKAREVNSKHLVRMLPI